MADKPTVQWTVGPPKGHAPVSGRSRKSFTRSSISLQSSDTVLLEMPESPMACTSSSTRRVETPPIHASCMTAPKSEAPKKGIFATASKTASKAAEETQNESQAEEGIPDQETPAEEAAREDATASNPFAGDENGDSDETQDETQSGDEATAEAPAEAPAEKPKSIFAFAPKKSAG